MGQWVNCLLPNKMAAISQTDIFKGILMNEKFCILIWIPLKSVPKVPTDNKSVLV